MVSKYIPFFSNINYLNWIINAILTVAIASTVTILINYVFFKKEFIDITKFLFVIMKGGIKKNGNIKNT